MPRKTGMAGRLQNFDVSFSDKSFTGPLCQKDLLRAVQSKCKKKESKVAIPMAK